MYLSRRILLLAAGVLAGADASAAEPSFTGVWSIDLRTPEQRAQHAECGEASFALKQTDKQVTGSHSMATVGCGRANEGGEGTVRGMVTGRRAVLVVTSSRSGAIVKGTATLRQDALYWETEEEIKAAEPAGDSALILGRGLLRRVKQ
jgi:hypothetical protein